MVASSHRHHVNPFMQHHILHGHGVRIFDQILINFRVFYYSPTTLGLDILLHGEGGGERERWEV